MKEVQTIRVPQDLQETPENLGVYALWAMCHWLFGNPKKCFKTPYGGLKRTLRNYTRLGSTFEPFYDVFTQKYMKIVRISVGNDKFESRYELYTTPHEDIPPIRYLLAEEAEEYLASHPFPLIDGVNEEELEKSNLIRVAMLTDNSISLRAKGLFILMKRETVQAQNDPSHIANKRTIMDTYGFRRAAIDPAWNECLDSGYIYQERDFDPVTRTISWKYSLHDLNPQRSIHKRRKSSKKTKKTKTINNQKKHIEKSAHYPVKTAAVSADYSKIKNIICENIGYDSLLEHANKSDLDNYVQWLIKAICQTKPTVKLGGQRIPTQTVREQLMKLTGAHICNVIKRVSKHKNLRNPEFYTLTSLYKESFNTEISEIPCSKREPSFDLDEYEEMVNNFTPVYQRYSA